LVHTQIYVYTLLTQIRILTLETTNANFLTCHVTHTCRVGNTMVSKPVKAQNIKKSRGEEVLLDFSDKVEPVFLCFTMRTNMSDELLVNVQHCAKNVA